MSEETGQAEEKTAIEILANPPKRNHKMPEIAKEMGKPYRFQKGKSGNPRGRPKKDFAAVEAAAVHGKAAIDTLAAVMKDKKVPHATRVQAANTLLERGFGKAPQKIDLEANITIDAAFEMFITELNDKTQQALGTATASPKKVVDADFTELLTDS